MNSPIPGTTIQSLMFPKALYTPARAASWATRNGFDGSAPDVGSTAATMTRVRLKAPTKFVKGSFRTIPLGEGVKAVIGVPIPAARRNPAKRRRINGDVLPFRRRGAPVPMKHYVGDSDEDVSDAPTVERTIVRQTKAGRTAKPKAPKVSDSFPIDEVIAMDRAYYGGGVPRRSVWYPLSATYGQYIVNISESGGKYHVAYAAVGTDTGNPPRFEAWITRGDNNNVFKTKAGASRAALKFLARNDRTAHTNPHKKLRRNTVVGDHVQVYGYIRKLPKRTKKLTEQSEPVTVRTPEQQLDDKQYYATLKKKYYELVAEMKEAVKQKQWLRAAELGRLGNDILLGDAWHTKWGQAAISPLYDLQAKINKSKHRYNPRKKLRRNTSHTS